MIDLVCFYAELGMGEGYQALMEAMTASARNVMPGSRLLLLAPKDARPADGICTLFDKMLPYPDVPDRTNLIYHKGRAMMTYSLGLRNPTAFVDPDVVFQRPIEFADDWHIALNWRRARGDQPVNAGLVLTKPDQIKFWLKYGEVLEALPRKLRWWYAEQIAFALMTGVCHKAGDTLPIAESKVHLMHSPDFCSPLEFAHADTIAVHYKGARKGPGWEGMFPKPDEAA